jgi:RHS repeat-associated protein
MLIPPDGSATTNHETTSYTGNTTTTIDEAGAKRVTTVDALGRVTQIAEGTAAYVTAYTYDALGNLTCSEQHGGVTGTGCSSPTTSDATSAWRVRRLTYDSLSRLLTATNPETGIVTYGYNADSVLTSETDARGITITITPDVLHRITGKSYSDGEHAIGYSYDAHSATNYGIGRRTGMTDGTGSTAWSYDQMGRTLSETRVIGSVTKTTSTLYNLDGSVSQITYPAESTAVGAHSLVLSITPGGAGLPLSISDTTNGITYVKSLVYAPTGQPSGAIYGSSSSYSGIVQTNSYNNRGQPVRLQACGLASCTDGSTSTTPYLLDLSYNFGLGVNDNGNVHGITNNKDSSRSQSFTYDGLNRVLTARTSSTWGVSFTNSANGAPGIDAWGNLIQTSTISGTATNPMAMSQQVNLKNQLSLSGYTYDAAGNVLTDGVNTGCGTNAYTWNAEEQMTCGAGATYSYDGNGARVMKTGGSSTSTEYWGVTPGAGALVESDLSGNVTSEYIFMHGRRVARRDVATGAVYYYFSDQLGSSNVVAGSTGALVNESDFYPFGGERPVTLNLSNQHYKFTGVERDSESGLDHFDFRAYGSNAGRWVSPDAVFGSVYDPQTLNRYSYVTNNPLRLIDPLGLCGQQPSTNPQIQPNQTWCDVVTPKGSTGPFLCGCLGNPGGSVGGIGGGGGSSSGQHGGSQSGADGMADNPMAQALFHGQGQPYWGGANKMVEYATLGTAGAYALAGTVVAGIIVAPSVAELAVHLAARGTGWYLGLTGSGTGVVLGQFNAYTNYLTAARSIGANALSVPMRVFYFFDEAGEWWTLNEAFIDASIARGQQFFMSSPVLGASGNYSLELQYLTQRGIDASQWVMVRLPY